MVSLATLLSYQWSSPLGGVLGLSGLQALDHEELSWSAKAQIKQTPLFLYHGKADGKLPASNSELTYEYLKNSVYTGDYQKNFSYTSEVWLGHSISDWERGAIKAWLA